MTIKLDAQMHLISVEEHPSLLMASPKQLIAQEGSCALLGICALMSEAIERRLIISDTNCID